MFLLVSVVNAVVAACYERALLKLLSCFFSFSPSNFVEYKPN